MPTIVICCQASQSQGMGHLVRQLHLADLFRRRGLDVSFRIEDFSPATGAVREAGFNCQVMKSDRSFPDRPEETDLAILDRGNNEAEFIQFLRCRARKIVSFEDLGDGRNGVDLLIDANRGETAGTLVSPAVRTLLGPQYIVLHPDFEVYHQRSRDFSSRIGSVLITLGGTDPKNLTVPVARTVLENNSRLPVTVVAGPGFLDEAALEQLQNGAEKLRVLKNLSSLAEVLTTHDAVFCSGGITLHEALAVGTPAFVVNQVAHLFAKAEFFAGAGAVVNLGLAENWEKGRVGKILEMDGDHLAAMSRAGKNMVDARGRSRVAGEILKLLA